LNELNGIKGRSLAGDDRKIRVTKRLKMRENTPKRGAMTFSLTTHRVMTLSLKTLSIMGLFATFSINDIEHK
jgi:hypothetical protein